MIEVLITGAGPTGLTLACDLARRGIDFRIVERAPRPVTWSRAKALQPRAIEVLDDLGMAARLSELGRTHVLTRHHDGVTGRVNDIDLAEGIAPADGIPYPAPLWIAEPHVELVLRERLAELGHRVEFGAEVVSLTQQDDSVTATVRDGRQIAARYLVGADGGRSSVRRLAGIAMSGGYNRNESTSSWWLGDLRLDGLDRNRHWVWTAPGKGMLSLFPLPGTDIWQFQASVLQAGDDLPAPSLEAYSEIIAQRSGRTDLNPREAGWLALYRVNVALADRYRSGRVFLAGDAAHVHSPAGGQGMNTGIQDAYNLGWKVAAALRGSDPALLDTYEAERRPVARAVLDDTVGRGRAVLGGLERGEVGMGALTDDFTTGLRIAYPESPLTVRGAGERASDGPTALGRRFDLFRGPYWTLLTPPAAEQAAHPALRVFPVGEEELVLVRPDGYVAMRCPVSEIGRVRHYLDRWAGASAAVPASTRSGD